MPYPYDCHRFINCAEGRPAIQTCESGTAFNSEKRTCDQQSKVSCEGPVSRSARLQQRSGEPKCSPGKSGLEVHPYDCTKFLNCANGRTFVQSCGPGTAFSPSLMTCDYKDKVDCGDGRFSAGGAAHEGSQGSTDGLHCPAGARGNFPYANDPIKYIVCGIGVKPRLEQCDPGEIFDIHKLTCIFVGSSSAQTHVSSAASLSGLHCPEGVEGLFTHPFDQTKFLNCKAGNVAVQSCPPNQIFSISKSGCQFKAQSVYTDYVSYIVSGISHDYSMMLTSCPPGTDGLHLYPYDAAKYVRCAGGVLSIISCGENMAYSFIKRACRLTYHLTREERVWFFYELSSISRSHYSYTDSQAFQSSLTSCPLSLHGNYAYPFVASRYVLCQNGLLQVESCPGGTFFSLSTRRCVARQQLSSHEYLDYSYINIQLPTTTMQDLTTVTCPASAQGYYLHPFDCTKYLNCRDQQTSIESCDKGKVFSISQRLCVATDQLAGNNDRVEYLTETPNEFYQGNQVAEGHQLHTTQNANREVVCPSGVSGLHPHPHDCTKYLNCANGQTFVMDCGPGTAFSVSLLSCDFKDNVDCERHSFTGNTATSHGGSASSSGSGFSGHGGLGHGSFNGAGCPAGARGLFPIPSDPQSYLKCGIGVQPIVEQCNPGQIFDAHSLSCVRPAYSPGPTPPSSAAKLSNLLCPEGVEGLFAHPFDQTKFFDCKAGQVAVQSCPPSQVFSLSRNYCQPKSQLVSIDYVAYFVSEINHEYSMMLTSCPAGTDGLHLYPYDAAKYVHCSGGVMSIISCGENMAYSFTQRTCRPTHQISREERVKFIVELSFHGSSGNTGSQAFQSSLTLCPHSLQGKYAHPFHASHYIICQNGVLRVESCPAGYVYSISKRRCSARQQLSSHEYLDYSYINNHLSTNFLQDIASVKCPADGQGYYLHPFDCTKYLNCRNQQTYIESCERGKVFSISQRLCVATDQLAATYDRVEYLSETPHEFYQGGRGSPSPSGSGYGGSSGHISGAFNGAGCPAGARGLFPIPSDPQSYLKCGIGVQPIVEQCNPGQIFDAHSLSCVRPAYSPGPTISSSASKLSNLLCPEGVEGLFAHPFDQTKFFDCKAGQVAVQSCPPSQVFSLSRNYCQPKSQLVSIDYVAYFVSEINHEYSMMLTSCPAGTDGLHLYPYDAAKYVHCSGGVMSIISCGENMAYSFTQRTCRPTHQISREERVKFIVELSFHGSSGNTGSQAFQSSLASCPHSLQGKYVHPFLASHYVICQNGVLQVESCPTGYVYSISLHKCSNRQQLSSHDYLDYSYINNHLSTNLVQDLTTVKCPPNAQGYYLHPFDCTKYLNCRNQQTYIESCERGKVFSISQRLCVPTDQLAATYDRVEYLTETANEFYQGNQVTRDHHWHTPSQYPIGEAGSSSSSGWGSSSYGGSSGHISGSVSGASCPHGARGLFPIPNDPHKYLKCGIGVETRVEQCNPGEIFDAHSLTCVSTGDFTIQTPTSSMMFSRCPSGTDGHHFYPYDAAKYVRCAGGVMSIISCGENMAYSFTQRTCRPTHQVSREERVKFIVELSFTGSSGNSHSHELQSLLPSCPQGGQGKYAHPFLASHYVICENGVLQVESCPAGYVYSISLHKCSNRQQLSSHDYLDYSYINSQPSTNLVQDLTTVKCPPNAQGYYLHPFDCTKYLNCRNQQTYIESCERGKVFSISQRLCVNRDQLVAAYDRVEYPTEMQHEFYQGSDNANGRQLYPTEHSLKVEITCPPGASRLHPHPYDCTKYLNCANRQILMQECRPGSAFNSAKGICEHADQVDCTGRSRSAVQTAVQFTSTVIGASYHLTCPENVYGMFAHPFDARSYLYCVQGYTSIRQCLPTEYFSISRGYCLSEQLVSATDRVSMMGYVQEAGLQQVDFVSCPRDAVGYHAYPFDCTKYLSCEAGVTRLQSCPNGQHFSLSLHSCQLPEQVQRNDRIHLSSELHTFFEWWQQLQRQGVTVSILCPPGLIGNYQHPTLPSKYIACTAPQAPAQIRNCDSDQIFSVSRRVCMPGNQVPTYDRCDYNAEDSYGWIDLRHDGRTPKAYGSHTQYGSSDQYGSGSGGIKTTVVRTGDRWTSMNMPRPAGIGFGHDGASTQHSQASGWSGQGSAYSHQAPTQSVLYVEGSLQPNRNYPQHSATNTIYKAALAPMATTPTSNIYYAQPVKETGASSRSDFGRAQTNNWQTSRRPFNSHSSNGQRPLELDYQPDEDDQQPRQASRRPFNPQSSTGQRPLDLDYQPDEDDQQPRQASRRPFNPQSSTGQRPLDLDYQPDEDDQQPRSAHDQQPSASQLQPRDHFQTSLPKVPANHRPTFHAQPHSPSDESNLYGGLKPPPPPPNSPFIPVHPKHNPHAATPTGQRPLDIDYQPDYDDQEPRPAASGDQQPSFHAQPHSRSDESNLYGGLQPPPLPPNSPLSPIRPKQNPHALPTGQRPLDLDYNPDTDSQQPHAQPHPSYTPVSPVPANHRPTYRDPKPVTNESNLYGGLQPPPPPSAPSQTTPVPSTSSTNLRTYPIYPPVFNATPPHTPNNPHYSPSYSGVAHSYNATWQKVPPAPAHDPFNAPEDYVEADNDDDDSVTTTTTEPSNLRPPPFDHKFYNPTQAAATQPSKVALGEALRLMLRPYFNHSGNAEESLAQRAESAIATAISKPPTSSKHPTRTTTPTTTTTTSRSPNRGRQTLDDDAELIMAGEQESLDDTDNESVVPGAVETARTEQTLNPTTYASGHDTTDFQRGTRRVDIDTTTNSNTNQTPIQSTNNWHTRVHNREFHQRHPNLPDPFDKPQQHHNHHHPHHRHQHSPHYHKLHPELPNPFDQPKEVQPQPFFDEQPQQEFEEFDPDYLPNPNAEATTPHTPKVDFRSGFDVTCEFDCGGGKCVKHLEVCDGVNNCGNRKDESQCDHLGYQVRLTGGESPHMGRVEVKVNGKWGYVCDDKFGLPDADVVCRELGHKMGASEVRGNSYYEPPERNFNYVMDEIECRGNETHLKDCDFKGWGVHNCGVDEVVGVVCKVPVLKCPNNFWLCKTSKECIPPAFVCDNTEDCADKSDESNAVCKAPIEYRLEGGRSSNEGRLEVKYHDVWGSVCDDDFNLKSAQVACNALGYYGPAKIEKNIFGPGNGPIWLDQVMCVGNETSIDQCRHWNWGEHNCNHTEDLGLRCTAGPPPRTSRQRTRLEVVSKNQTAAGKGGKGVSLSDIGLWERSSKALHTPRRCGIFKDDLFDEFAHPEQRVIKGNVARRGRHPWQATIRKRGRASISSHWCGAVVISKRHLLTAAHCLYGQLKGGFFVRVGDHYADIAEHSEVDSFIERWYTHEQFRQPTHMNNDIAVVVLKTPLKFNDYVQPICLPDLDAPLLENRTCTISGWGSIKSGMSTPSQELRAAQLPILPEDTCKQMNVYGDAMTKGMFCAGSMDESVDACEGDSGGPLVCSDEDGETLYGIISWGQHCGYRNRPGVYVRVCHYIDWIYEKINQSLRHF
ncbi:GH15575 [Drosophila grimshawi]|uniref:GH15575 n=1 Tax=Drosophila grimshawi TaxID=7222 RepID=B4J0X5_DROGR|nr:GH15575 [Drosophila grimshawi]